MQIHNLVQGTPEWHAYRANHFNASDAPAMLGVSPYKTRSELLQEYATGTAKEIDSSTQKRFDNGHKFEALARPLGEEIIGQDLYPVVGSQGKYSASFDGLTMFEDVAFEHKSLNDDLRAVLVEGCTGADLPKAYRVQMEQQCMVSGCQRVLFMASKWNGDELEEERHCWYEPDASLRKEIIDGWMQFEQDVAAYMPPEVAIEVIGRTPETLPALRIEVTGAVTASNINDFKVHALAVFQGINRDLQTDQDFANAEKTVKWCGDVESRLAAAKQHALSQTESIDALFRVIDEISAETRATRLELDKLVKARKEQVRTEILQEGVTALRKHIADLNARLDKPYMPTIPADFAGAMKGKKTVASLRDAVDTTLANAKIEANAIADRIQTNLTTLREQAADYVFLFADTAQIVLKPVDDCTTLIKMRIADHKAAEEQRLAAERERIAAEERQKAEALAAEASRKAVDEAAAKAREEERQRIAEEQAEVRRTAQAQTKHVNGAPMFGVHVKENGDRVMLDDQGNRSIFCDIDEEGGTSAPALGGMRVVASATPTLRLGQISERLGFTVTADFLTSIGFVPAATEKSAKLYHEADFPIICQAIADRSIAVGRQYANQIAA